MVTTTARSLKLQIRRMQTRDEAKLLETVGRRVTETEAVEADASSFWNHYVQERLRHFAQDSLRGKS